MTCSCLVTSFLARIHWLGMFLTVSRELVVHKQLTTNDHQSDYMWSYVLRNLAL
jgi:hypothetical protein